VSVAESVNGFLAKWFKDNATGPLAPFAATWSGQYVTEKVSGSHHHQIGARHVAGDNERDKAQSGLTGPSKDAGVPKYTPGTGNLEKGLKGLPGDARRPASKHALLALDPDEVLV
jgi:hypothetical protein